jgi:hypothetical protein
LTGKKKIDIQNKLASLGLIEKIIDPLFDLLFSKECCSEGQDEVNVDISVFLKTGWF